MCTFIALRLLWSSKKELRGTLHFGICWSTVRFLGSLPCDWRMRHVGCKPYVATQMRQNSLPLQRNVSSGTDVSKSVQRIVAPLNHIEFLLHYMNNNQHIIIHIIQDARSTKHTYISLILHWKDAIKVARDIISFKRRWVVPFTETRFYYSTKRSQRSLKYQNCNFLPFNLKVIVPLGLRNSECQPGTNNYEIIISQLIHISKYPGFLL
jgi:hypothetical protein